MSIVPDHAALCRRVEEAGLNALPAPHQILLDGWLLRFANGYTRRANSATCLSGDLPTAREGTIEACERLYAAKRLPSLFRVLSFQGPALDAALDARCYAPAEGESCVLWTRLAAGLPAKDGVELTEGQPDDAWVAAQTRITGAPEAAQRAILDRIAVPVACAAMRLDGPGTRLAALACGAVHDGILVLQMIVTDPAARRRGLARHTVGAVMAWAQRIGAREACLQVGSANVGALRLYDQLGFGTELYRYHYRRRATTE